MCQIQPKNFRTWKMGLFKMPCVETPFLKQMQKHSFVTFIDWEKLIFRDEHLTQGGTMYRSGKLALQDQFGRSKGLFGSAG